MRDPVSGYDRDAAELARRYEALDPEKVHGAFTDLIGRGEGRLALDVGAGSGRDAAWLARQGFDVVAAEPSAAMRAQGQMRHTHPNLRWIADRLPELSAVHRLGVGFDLILASGVLMHVPPASRRRALRKLATLLRPSGLLLISVRSGPGDPDRPMWEVTEAELEAAAAELGLAMVRIRHSKDLMDRQGVAWTSFALRLPDDGSGALALLRGLILNDDKSATYKLGLLRAIARIADTAPSLAIADPMEDQVSLPLGLVALNWVRLYLPLVAANLPQRPGNGGPDGLGFAKAGFRELLALQFQGQDLRIGARFTDERALALRLALQEAQATLCRMPVRYMRLPGSTRQVFDARPARSPRATKDLTIDEAMLGATGTLSVPGALWRALQRLGPWIEPVLTGEWRRLMESYAERQGRRLDLAACERALRWQDPDRATRTAREAALGLIAREGTVRCVWTGSHLAAERLDIDHCLPWSAWPCADLWNLMPAARSVNQREKRNLLPSASALTEARPHVLAWWEQAWENDPALKTRFHLEARAALAVGPTSGLEELFGGLEWRRLRLRQDQQVEEWAGSRARVRQPTATSFTDNTVIPPGGEP